MAPWEKKGNRRGGGERKRPALGNGPSLPPGNEKRKKLSLNRRNGEQNSREGEASAKYFAGMSKRSLGCVSCSFAILQRKRAEEKKRISVEAKFVGLPNLGWSGDVVCEASLEEMRT